MRMKSGKLGPDAASLVATGRWKCQGRLVATEAFYFSVFKVLQLSIDKLHSAVARVTVIINH